MDDLILRKESAFESGYAILSPQRSATSEGSLCSSPDVVNLYTTHPSIGGVKTSYDSRGLSSSFIMVTDESNVGDISSEYVQVASSSEKSVSASTSLNDVFAQRDLQLWPKPGSAALSVKSLGKTESYPPSLSEKSVTKEETPGALNVDDHSIVQLSTKESAWSLVSTSVPDDQRPTVTTAELLPNHEEPLRDWEEPLKQKSFEMGIQTTSANIRDWSTQTSTEIQCPTASTSTSVLCEHHTSDDIELSPLVSPCDEIVDMSASTVLVERHISQKEGRMLKSQNKELSKKIKKLTEVLQQMRIENERLKSAEGSKVKFESLELKEKELRRHIEELEEQHRLEMEECKMELEKSKKQLQEAEERSTEKLKEIGEVIVDLQDRISILQEEMLESKKELEKSAEKVKLLNGKLQASEMKRVVVKSENSVLNDKLDYLMKELATLKKSKQHHHHHDHLPDDKSKQNVHSSKSVYERSPRNNPERLEVVSSSKTREEQKQVKQIASGASQGVDVVKRASSDASLKSCPKPKPRQLYETHSIPHSSHDHKTKQKESKPDYRPVHLQALVAPNLPFVGKNLQAVKDLIASGAAKRDLPPYHQQPQIAQAKPTPPLSDAQKYVATANWVDKLQKPDDSRPTPDKTEKERRQASAGIVKPEDHREVGGVRNYRDQREDNDLNSVSEKRIEEIARELKGEEGGNAIECPICGEWLHSRGLSDYGVRLHVEKCLQRSETDTRN